MDPFVGLDLWYWPGMDDSIGEVGQPLAATVASVLDSGCLNLAVLDPHGRPCSRQNVPFVEQPGETTCCTLRPDQVKTSEPPPEKEVSSGELQDVDPTGFSRPEDSPVEEPKPPKKKRW